MFHAFIVYLFPYNFILDVIVLLWFRKLSFNVYVAAPANRRGMRVIVFIADYNVYLSLSYVHDVSMYMSVECRLKVSVWVAFVQAHSSPSEEVRLAAYFYVNSGFSIFLFYYYLLAVFIDAHCAVLFTWKEWFFCRFLNSREKNRKN